jgi:hypothetical protein
VKPCGERAIDRLIRQFAAKRPAADARQIAAFLSWAYSLGYVLRYDEELDENHPAHAAYARLARPEGDAS